MAVEDGVSVGCQPSWDASVSPRCLTFLLALSKNKKKLKIIFCCFILLIFSLHGRFYGPTTLGTRPGLRAKFFAISYVNSYEFFI